MAGTDKQQNPYTPGTMEYQEYERELQRQTKTDYENSAEGQQAKEDARKKMEIKKQQEEIKKRTSGGGGITGGATGNNWRLATPQQKAQFVKEEAQKNGVTLSDEDVKQVKDEYLKEVTPAGVDPYAKTAKNAQAGVNRLGDFDMPKGNINDLSTYELIGDKAKQEGIFPKSIWQAWKKGEFGDPEGKESQQVRNNLILNSAMTAIGNAARGFRAGLNHGDAEHKDSLWQKRQEANMERQTERENQQLDVLKQAETDTQLADMWGSFTPAQKQGLLDAKNAFANGKYADADNLMRSSMGDEKYAQWLQYFDNLKAQLSINADARAQEQVRYMEAMGPLGLAVSLLGKFI